MSIEKIKKDVIRILMLPIPVKSGGKELGAILIALGMERVGWKLLLEFWEMKNLKESMEGLGLAYPVLFVMVKNSLNRQ